MKEKIIDTILSVAMILIIVGLLLINASWIIFILIAAAKLFHFASYPWFALTEISVIGTPVELIVGGILSVVTALLMRSITLRMGFYK